MKKQTNYFIQLVIVVLTGIGCSFLRVEKYPLLFLGFLILVVIVQSIISKKQAQQLSLLQDEIKGYKEQYKKMGYELNVASSQVSSVSQNLYLTLEDNTAFTQQLFAQTEEMASLNSGVTTTIHHTITSIKGVLSALEELEIRNVHLKDISLNSNEVIHNSLVEILDIVNTIKEIQSSSDLTITYMTRLNDTSKEIVHILTTVNNISAQTHLLALNASIESARAGDAGKGFAVVADEIRKLSMSTSEAVKDVNALIDSIQKELNTVNAHVMENSKKVETGVAKFKEVENSLDKIQDSFGQVVDLVDDITRLSAEETQLAQVVDQSIGLVEESIDRTTASVECVVDSVNKQKNNIEEVADMGNLLHEASHMLSLLLSDHKLDVMISLKENAITDYLEHFNKMVATLSQDKGFVRLDSFVHQEALQSLMREYPFIEAIWTNGHKGRFIASIPPAGIVNANVREWFQESIKGEYYVSTPYISAITRTPCITLSAPIRDDLGAITGVIGIDIKLES